MIAALFLIGVTGMSIGSFVNACAFRIPRNISVVGTQSFCPACNCTLRWYELIPLLSFICLGGRCSGCGSRIPVHDVVVEVIGAALGLVLFLRCGLSWQCAFLLVASNLFLLIALIDWQHLIIPNALIAAGMIIALVFHVVNGMSEVLISVSSVGGSSLVMMLLKASGDAIFKKQSMGMGDVKLAAVVGLFVGFIGFLAVLWIAALIGILYAGSMRTFGRRGEFTSRGSHLIRSGDAGSASNLLPFGSFLSVVTILFFVFDVRAQLLIDTWLTLMQ